MAKPTKQEYEEALKNKSNIADWLHMEYKKRDELLDALLDTRENIKTYLGLYEKEKEIVRMYEIYEEIENGIQI